MGHWSMIDGDGHTSRIEPLAMKEDFLELAVRFLPSPVRDDTQWSHHISTAPVQAAEQKERTHEAAA